MEYILTNFILCVRRNFKNVTIELAIHSHTAPTFRLRGGRIWVVLLHQYIHAYKIICFFNT